MTTTRRAALLAAPTLLLGSRLARSQGSGTGAWPTRPVRIVVPYTPGGVSDITARLIAEPMAAAMGVAVPVENRAGADGVIGTEVVARAPADGHTLALVSVGHPVNAAFYRLPYDTMRDFTFISLTTKTPLVLCAARGFGPSTPAELVAHAKARPAGQVTFAGTGGVVRLAPVLFGQRTGIEMTYVPYRGSTQAHPDLIAGRVDIMFDTVPAALPHIQAGTLKALATTGAVRAPQLPDVPTLGETVAGFEASTWGMVMGPANLPRPVLDRLHREITAAVTRPEIVARHRALGAEVVTSNPDETRGFVQAEMEKWGAAARAAGVQPQNAG
ncbi:tripartite tricarboxylate transporter substrate binding protein [Falsiroseomonas tokyonensis]|uniref:Tripartite tricarboxylate transporter substrate binding protein n=1 Tax=Falsiroseomonas tokyonensis TaxID=430521 RepID=A0ABV7BPQ0_9PROT|nr:tripartite tricarboxylate transporter substrate binding protein [Falsiroseomonas tokyonensis]MBU8536449.1 tripartite tricarboxylate transporter substrate binding protein [Falsiroseomonas tokyonensis]